MKDYGVKSWTNNTEDSEIFTFFFQKKIIEWAYLSSSYLVFPSRQSFELIHSNLGDMTINQWIHQRDPLEILHSHEHKLNYEQGRVCEPGVWWTNH